MDLKEKIAKTPFFRRVDWASFWTATMLSFLVYFFTLGPSVGLEDSGELAVAGDHLGVPHPPGYPIWSIISFCFARVFSFVTFRGQPNPAWAIALGSAVFGALAAGCTAMLITRSARDMLELMGRDEGDGEIPPAPRRDLDRWCFVGGVSGSLVFAFSPVMWSQSTIVEVYSLGAFFLMLVMLLTYRWMRRPSDKLLWITAFVFGLGLTNYQVLLLSALPLVVIIFLRNAALFRDFMLVTIPFGLGATILKLGSLAQQIDLPKRVPLKAAVPIPNAALCTAGAVALGLALAAMVAYAASARHDGGVAVADRRRSVFAIVAGALLGASLLCLLFAGSFAAEGVVGTENPANIALMEPMKYLRFATLLAGVLGLGAYAAAFRRGGGWDDPLFFAPAIGAALLAAVALFSAAAIPGPVLPANIDTRSVPVLGIGQYNAMFAIGVVALLALAATARGGLLFALPVAAIEVVLYILVLKGVLLGLTHPSTWWFCAPAFFNFALLALAALALPNGRSVAATYFAAELGLSFYVYMPIVSDLRNPPMNWGYPRTWEGFKHAITRGQYEAIKPTNIFTMRFVSQLGDYFTDLRRQFTLLLAPFGFLPFAAWGLGARAAARPAPAARRRRILASLALVALAAVLWGLDSFVADSAIPDRLSWALRALGIVALVAGAVMSMAAGVRPLLLALVSIAATVVFVVLGNIPAIERNFDASRIDKLFIGGLLTLGVVGGLCFVVEQAAGLVGSALRAVGWRGRADGADEGGEGLPAEGPDAGAGPRVRLPAVSLFDNVSQQWLIGTVCNFLVMSVVLIMLANPKGDLQDTFIQKVKFIASHGLFALWIGYGLVIALQVVDGILRRILPGGAARPAMAVAAALVFLAPLIPIEQNYCNDRLVFELSGAEQNGHDYGWQFGNYQLRGADAIREELEDDEEPLPNPLYPPEMGRGAVFFGGTDPGRFVPTYMIYSADVRPDVFLITQNALADNTFMSVTRDLYGDQLWIPTPADSESAFSEFVADVNAGRRQANSDIVVENGRVQIVGALGVMEINGILCRQIFERNKRWHDFYVEESYVIPWMYPYLTPHGLIMKINSERTPLSAANTEDDMDFWDWYVRRMTTDGKYRRDIVAQKSFSKLRSAIAGLYMNRGRIREAERAYNDARVLYPVSPEATFRYVQDILMRQRRYAEAMEAIGYFCEKDPNNERGPYVLGVIGDIVAADRRLAEIMARRGPDGSLGVADRVEMAEIQLKSGDVAAARRSLEGLASAPGLSVPECLRIALLLDEAGEVSEAAKAMDRIWRKDAVRRSPEALRLAARIYEGTADVEKLAVLLPLHLERTPGDWQGWLAFANINGLRGRMDAAADALERAIQGGGERVVPMVEGNATLTAAYRHMVARMRRRQQGGAAPWGAAMPMERK